MSALEELVQAGVEKRVARIRELDREWRVVQRDKLAAILARNADTEFGRAHGFAGIDGYDGYRRAVPRSVAEDYVQGWNRVHEGARKVYCADPPIGFALTSGSTGTPKVVPVTKALMRGLKRAVGHAVACHMERTEDYSLLRGYALQVAAQGVVRRSPEGLPVGFGTGLMGADRPYPFHQIGIPPAEVLDLEDWGEKYRIIDEQYADRDVRMILGVPAYVLALLRHITAARGIPDLRELWPGLRLLVTSGASLAEYRDRFAALLGDRVEQVEMFLTSEAPIGFQPDPATPGFMPMVEDCVFELVPRDRWEEDDPPRLPLEEAEPGVPYVLLLTTAAGLYAYAPKDVVRFLSVDPPRFEFVDRVAATINLSVEKVNGAQAEMALERAGVRCDGFLVCPSRGDDPAHEWVIEFREEPPADVAERIDRELRRLNPTYDTVREGDRVLGAPVITRVPRGTFADFLGRREGQAKLLRIYRDRETRDRLLAGS